MQWLWVVPCGDENALPEDAGTPSVTESAADSALDDTSESDAETETEEEKAEAETEEETGEKEFEMEEFVGIASDYSDTNNWFAIPEITHEIDTIYIYPTCYIDESKGAAEICDIDNEQMRETVAIMYESQATVYVDSTNVFVPYYRQSNITVLSNFSNPADVEKFQKQEQRTDLYAALDYYFENYNDGRSYILAGHSQGSMMMRIILGEYMQAHPEYYERMVAAYQIGYSVTQDWLDEHPYAKFAEGANDTGVIISWNTEGPGNKGHNNSVVLLGAISINPLNWKRDDTYAGVEENLGSLVLNEETGKYELGDGIGDAQIDMDRGVVVCTTNDDYIEYEEIFGPQSLHTNDYTLYYVNLKKNVADRVENYLKNN